MSFYKKFSFLDSKNKRFAIEAETYGDGRLSLSGDYGGGCGQCYDSIEPANQAQKDLVELWEKYQLKIVDEEVKNKLTDIINQIEVVESARIDGAKKLTELSDEEALELIDDQTNLYSEEVEKYLALLRHLDLTTADVDPDIFIDGNKITIQGFDYLVCTDEQADSEFEDSIENYVDDCVILEIPKHLQQYFDTDRFIEDAKYNFGRGQQLNYYDGSEYEQEVKGTTYYIYQQ
jgi:hypothetical protein